MMKRVAIALLLTGALPTGGLRAQDDVWNITLGQGLNLLSVPSRPATTRLLTLGDLVSKIHGCVMAGRTAIDPNTGRTKFVPYIPGLNQNPLLDKGGNTGYFLGMRTFMTAAFHSNVTVNPDQKLIVFETDRWATTSINGTPIRKLALMNEDGSEQRPLMPSEVNTPRHQLDPSWSPDGAWIYFANQEVTGDITKFSIARVRIDGTGFERVTNRNVDGSFNGSTVPHRYPRVDFGGEYLFYTQYRTSGSQTIEGDIYRMKLDGSELVNLTPNTFASDDVYAIATPDRRYVVFNSSRSGKYQVWRMGWDGSVPDQLTEEPIGIGLGDVAMTNGTILYSTRVDGVIRMFIINVDGQGRKPITAESFYQDYGNFSRMAEKIAFESKKDGNFEVYLVDSDGTNLRRLTSSASSLDGAPRIQP